MSALLGRVGTVAVNTFKEAVRNRAFVGLMLGALALILLSFVLGELVVFDQRRRMVQDFGLFFISVAGVAIALVVGTLLIYKELERKTVYSILSKPLRRWEYLIGKYAGMLLIQAVAVVAMSGAWALVLWSKEVAFRWELVQAVLLIFGQLAVVTAVALFFSSFSTPILSGIFTLAVYAIGREIPFIQELMRADKGLFVSFPEARPVADAVVAIFPDLTLFDITREILLEVAVPWSYVAQSLGYGLAYVVVLLVLGAAIFQRKDFV
jgi:ABC-type transport system involved in multi-copper enzyme maturation permease subunit